jgi:hypothetical protein
LEQSLKVNNFDLRVSYPGELRVFDKIHDLIQNGIHSLPIIRDSTDPQHRFLPQILILHFRDGDVEPLSRPLHDTLQDLSLSLEGKIPVEEKFQVTHPNDHVPSPPRLQMSGDFFDRV